MVTSAVRKAVFPVAGLGTRFLPATKASPKEMLSIVDKPLIQYAAEEAIEAGCTELIFITGRSKRAIEDHFDRSVELESELEARGKDELLRSVRGILPEGVTCIYIRQSEPLGLGHAVLCARPAVGREPFAVILPDDLITAIRMDRAVWRKCVEPSTMSNAVWWPFRKSPRMRLTVTASSALLVMPSECKGSRPLLKNRRQPMRLRIWLWLGAMC